MTVELKIDEGLLWVNEGVLIRPKITNVKQAKYYKEKGLIVVLAGNNKNLSDKIYGISEDGRVMFEKSPMEGYKFQYLSYQSLTDITLVCVVIDKQITNEKWPNIHFSVNSKNGELKRIGVAR
jgi:hypothetical protein